MDQEFLNLLQDPNTQAPPTYPRVAKKFYGDQETIKNPAGFAPKFCHDIEYEEVCSGELLALTSSKPRKHFYNLRYKLQGFRFHSAAIFLILNPLC